MCKGNDKRFSDNLFDTFSGDTNIIPFPKLKKQKAKANKKWLNLKGWWVKPTWKTTGRLRPIAWHLKCKVTVQQIRDRAHTQVWHQASGGEPFIYMCVGTGSSSSISLPMNIAITRGSIPHPSDHDHTDWCHRMWLRWSWCSRWTAHVFPVTVSEMLVMRTLIVVIFNHQHSHVCSL